MVRVCQGQIALISHASKVMLKILQARLQSHRDFPVCAVVKTPTSNTGVRFLVGELRHHVPWCSRRKTAWKMTVFQERPTCVSFA